MIEVIKALNTALLNLVWWKSLIIIIFYPVLLVVTYFLWRVADKLTETPKEEEKE